VLFKPHKMCFKAHFFHQLAAFNWSCLLSRPYSNFQFAEAADIRTHSPPCIALSMNKFYFVVTPRLQQKPHKSFPLAFLDLQKVEASHRLAVCHPGIKPRLGGKHPTEVGEVEPNVPEQRERGTYV